MKEAVIEPIEIDAAVWPSDLWLDQERRVLIAELAREVLGRIRRMPELRAEADACERIFFLAHRTGDFLEDNRESILEGNV